MENNQNDEIYQNKYKRLNKVFRVLGLILLPIGVILLLIGTIEFFYTTSSFEEPKLFFLNFVGMPFIAVGTLCLSLGFKKQINEYHASQAAPVAKDVTNYMLDGTRDSTTRTVASIHKAITSNNNVNLNVNICEKCGQPNPIDSRFCSKCGAQIVIKCPNCGHEMDDGATFCNKCGYKLK
ncbi:MAG: zinc ribbon domain-containing protein [Bacilli bacterium]